MNFVLCLLRSGIIGGGCTPWPPRISATGHETSCQRTVGRGWQPGQMGVAATPLFRGAAVGGTWKESGGSNLKFLTTTPSTLAILLQVSFIVA